MSDASFPRRTLELELFADYFQFTLEDERQAERVSGTVFDPPHDWWEQLSTCMLAVDTGIIWVSTVRNMTIPIRLDLFDTPPLDEFSAWDHVAEASIDVPSGRLVVTWPAEYLPHAARFPIEPGTYRVRIYYGGLESISEDGLDGEDHYSIALWPATYQAPAILKRWPSLPLGSR